MRMRRRLPWTAALACTLFTVGASCSSSGDGADGSVPTVAPVRDAEPALLVSDDGVLEVEIPGVIVGSGVEPSIATVGAVPDGATAVAGPYELRPSGLVLPEPLIVTLRLPAPSLDAGGVPLVALVVDDGTTTAAAVEGRTAVGDSGELVHVTRIDRFGVLTLVDGGVAFELQPESIAELAVDEKADVTATARARPGVIEPWAVEKVDARWLVGGGFSGVADEDETVDDFGPDAAQDVWELRNELTCDAVGSGQYTVEFSVVFGAAFGSASGEDEDAPSRQIVEMTGEASCGDVGR